MMPPANVITFKNHYLALARSNTFVLMSTQSHVRTHPHTPTHAQTLAHAHTHTLLNSHFLKHTRTHPEWREVKVVSVENKHSKNLECLEAKTSKKRVQENLFCQHFKDRNVAT